MKIDKISIKLYPKFSYYVRYNLPQIIHVPVIVNAMKNIGQINLVRLRQIMIWGNLPLLKITDLNNAYGEFTPGIGSNEIRIDKKLVINFEKGKGITKSRAGNVYIVGVTILHELIHWGDDRDNIDRPGEEGEEFERLIYGSVIH